MKIKYQQTINNKFRKSFVDLVTKSKSIVITSHFSPDDDSIASVLSIYCYLTDYLKVNNKYVRIVYTGDKNDKWSSLYNFDKIQFVDDLYNHVSEKDMLILLDGNSLKRFSRKEEILDFSGKAICIDHHPMPSSQFDLMLVAKQFTSTAEIIYRLFFSNQTLSKEVCEILLVGLIGDTGSFRYINHKTSGVMSIAEKLIKKGEINVDSFYSKFQKIDKITYEILIELMKNSQVMSIAGWPDFVMSFIDMKKCLDKKYSDIQIGEAASSFMTYLRSIEKVDWGMIITPRLYDKSHSVSFRSSPGSVVTREIGEKMGIGGGHDRASGGKIKIDDTDKASKMLFDWMKVNKPSFS